LGGCIALAIYKPPLISVCPQLSSSSNIHLGDDYIAAAGAAAC